MSEDTNPKQPDNPQDPDSSNPPPSDPQSPSDGDISTDLQSLAKGLMVDVMWTMTGLKRKLNSRPANNPEDKPDK
jgi:hypothetical protein